jgi:hypothetical protein
MVSKTVSTLQVIVSAEVKAWVIKRAYSERRSVSNFVAGLIEDEMGRVANMANARVRGESDGLA